MFINTAGMSAGVTFHSQFLEGGDYYVLKTETDASNPLNTQFHLAHSALGTSICSQPYTGVTPVIAGITTSFYWHQFKIQTKVVAAGTEIKVKVWDFNSPEPSVWQISCLDNSSRALSRGTIGIWSATDSVGYRYTE